MNKSPCRSRKHYHEEAITIEQKIERVTHLSLVPSSVVCNELIKMSPVPTGPVDLDADAIKELREE